MSCRIVFSMIESEGKKKVMVFSNTLVSKLELHRTSSFHPAVFSQAIPHIRVSK